MKVLVLICLFLANIGYASSAGRSKPLDGRCNKLSVRKVLYIKVTENLADNVASEVTPVMLDLYKKMGVELDVSDINIQVTLNEFLGSKFATAKVQIIPEQRHFDVVLITKPNHLTRRVKLELDLFRTDAVWNDVGDLISYNCVLSVNPDYDMILPMILRNPVTQKEIMDVSFDNFSAVGIVNFSL